ncbi:hypothetical protein BH11ACT4_BH11ACT4_11570 [soil metagenome]
MATDFDPDAIVRQVTDSLAKKFPKQDRTAIESDVRAKVVELTDSPIHDYIGVLAERAVKQSLKRSS